VRTDRLHTWRSTAARAAALLPAQICSDADLAAIAAAPPSSADELSAIASFGPVTAAQVFEPIRAALDAADSSSA
jgi:ribonuclease D